MSGREMSAPGGGAPPVKGAPPGAGGSGPLRVALLARSVHPLHPFGGLERHVYDLVRHLLARGVRVTLVTRPATHPSAEQELAGHPGLEIIPVPYRTFPLAGRRGTTVADRSTAYLLFGYRAGRVAARLSAEKRVDIVHGLGAASLGYALARTSNAAAASAPFVFNPQGMEEFGATGAPPGAAAWLKRLAYLPLRRAVVRCARAADRVIATDVTLERVVQGHLPMAAGRIRVVPNAVDLEALDRLADPAMPARLRQRHDFDEAEPILLSVGRLEKNKGFHVLAGALRLLGQRRWRWVLCGDGPYRGEIGSLIGRYGLRERVILAGRVPENELHGWYRAAALFVHPTLYEGSSLVTLEAMACRRAVVGTTAGGLPDKIQPGRTGWLVPPGNESALAGALADALDDASRLEAMGDRARAVVERSFSWPAVTEMLLRVYSEILPGERAASLRTERLPGAGTRPGTAATRGTA